MKVKVVVITEQELEVEIPDSILTDEFLGEFERGITPLYGDNKRLELIKFAARLYYEGISFVEGVGPVGEAVIYNEGFTDIDIEVIECEGE